jgi:hypothetical protein
MCGCKTGDGKPALPFFLTVTTCCTAGSIFLLLGILNSAAPVFVAAFDFGVAAASGAAVGVALLTILCYRGRCQIHPARRRRVVVFGVWLTAAARNFRLVSALVLYTSSSLEVGNFCSTDSENELFNWSSSSDTDDQVTLLTRLLSSIRLGGRSTPQKVSGCLLVAATVWVMQKLLVIAAGVPVRCVPGLVALNGAVMLYFLCGALGDSFFQEADDAPLCWEWSLSAMSLATGLSELAVSVFAASLALLRVTTQAEVATRELFAWTRVLRLRTRRLQREAEPFNPTYIRQWLSRQKRVPDEALTVGARGGSSHHQHRTHDHGAPAMHAGDRDAPAESPAQVFWVIPSKELELVGKVAAGAAGVVWQARGGVFLRIPIACPTRRAMPRACAWGWCRPKDFQFRTAVSVMASSQTFLRSHNSNPPLRTTSKCLANCGQC